MEKQILSLVLIFLLAACAAPATKIPTATQLPTSTPTIVLTSTSTPTLTPTPEPTTTVTPAPKVEIVDYGACTIENFEKCPIPVEDLFNGKYEIYLKTLSRPFDPTKFKNPLPPLVRHGFFGIEYSQKTAPNFPNGGTPFYKGETYGVVTLPDGRKYIVLPTEYPNPTDPTNKDKNVWVITVSNLFSMAKKSEGRSLTNQELKTVIDGWQTMNIVPIETSPVNINSGLTDPLMERTFSQNPDIENRFDRFAEGDTTALDGLVLKTQIVLNYRPFK